MTQACPRLPKRFDAVGAALCFMLAACGGGGGGGGGAAPPAGGGATAATLAFTPLGFSSVPMRAVKATEQMMGFAQLVTDMAGRFVRKGLPATIVVPCYQGSGTATLTLTDRDGDGVASKGDRLAIAASACRVSALSDVVNGDITFELNGATAVKAGTVEGDLQLGSQLTNGAGKATWSGAFHTLRSRTALAQSWRITTPAGTSFSYSDSANALDTLRTVDVSKTVNYETAQSTLNLAMVFDTPAGTLAISTTTPITGYIQRGPDAGQVQFQGANGVVGMTAAQTGTSRTARFVLNGAGKEESYPWSTLTNGLMWWDGVRRLDRSDEVDRDTRDYAADSLSVELVTPPRDLMTASDALYQVQFSRPPVDLPALEYHFADVSAYGDPGWNVAATAERHGAAILLRPAESLRGGRTYAVIATLDGVQWSDWLDPAGNRKVHDAQGHELGLGTFGSFSAPLALLVDIEKSATSMASVAEQIKLKASVRPAIGANVAAASYHWSQVNGTPLRFSDPDAAVTTVSLGDVRASAVEQVQLQLTVTDSLGATEKTRTTITVGDIVDRPSWMTILGLPSMNGIPLRLDPALYFTPTYVPTRYADQFRDLYHDPIRTWDVQFGLPTGTLFAAGSYVFNGAGVALAATAPDMILQDPLEAPCTARRGSFKILDAAYGADGAPLRLAIDFTISCNGGPSLSGSYRHNSSIPSLDTKMSN